MKVNFTDLKSEFEFYEDQLISSFKSVGKKGEYVFGSELTKFEKNIKNFLNVKYVLGVGNWTEGMIMVCKALNLKKNDEIITVSNSFIATIEINLFNFLNRHHPFFIVYFLVLIKINLFQIYT